VPGQQRPKRYQRKTTPEKTAAQYARELGPEFQKNVDFILEVYLRSFYRWGPSAAQSILRLCAHRHAPRHPRSVLAKRYGLLAELLIPPGRSIYALAKEIERATKGETSFATAKDQIKDALQAARNDWEFDGRILPLSPGPSTKKCFSKRHGVWFYY
jgi:hypothetical protein